MNELTFLTSEQTKAEVCNAGGRAQASSSGGFINSPAVARLAESAIANTLPEVVTTLKDDGERELCFTPPDSDDLNVDFIFSDPCESDHDDNLNQHSERERVETDVSNDRVPLDLSALPSGYHI